MAEGEAKWHSFLNLRFAFPGSLRSSWRQVLPSEFPWSSHGCFIENSNIKVTLNAYEFSAARSQLQCLIAVYKITDNSVCCDWLNYSVFTKSVVPKLHFHQGPKSLLKHFCGSNIGITMIIACNCSHPHHWIDTSLQFLDAFFHFPGTSHSCLTSSPPPYKSQHFPLWSSLYPSPQMLLTWSWAFQYFCRKSGDL